MEKFSELIMQTIKMFSKYVSDILVGVTLTQNVPLIGMNYTFFNFYGFGMTGKYIDTA